MPRVPSYDGFVKTRPLQLPNATPEEFGGGRITTGIQSIASAVDRYRLEAQAVVDAEAELGLASVASRLNQDAQQVRGSAAVENVNAVLDQYDIESNAAVAKLPPSARARFGVASLRRRMQLEDGLNAHALKEQTAAYNAAQLGLLDDHMNNARRSAREGDVDASHESVRDAEEILAEMSTNSMTPWATDPEQAKRHAKDILSKVRAAQLEGLYEGKHFAEAKRLLASWTEGELNEEDRKSAQQGYNLARDADALNKHLTEAMTIADPVKRAEYIAGIVDDEGNRDAAMQQAVRNAVNGAVSATEDAISQNQKTVILRVDQDMADPANRGVDPTHLMSEDEARLLGAANIAGLRQRVSNFDDDSAFGAWDAVIRDPEGVKKVAAMSWAEAQTLYFSRLSTRRAQAEKDFDIIREGGRPGASAAQVRARDSLLTDTERSASVAERFGLKLTSTQAKDVRNKRHLEAWDLRYRNFRDAADAAITKRSIDQGGGQLSPTEFQEVLELTAMLQIREDTNRNAGSKSAATISGDLEDPINYMGPGEYDALLERTANTPEERLRFYVSEQSLDAIPWNVLNAQSELQKSNLRAAAIAELRSRVGGRVNNFNDFPIMRMGAAILLGDEDLKERIAASLR